MDISRRAFIKRASALSVAGSAAPFVMNLAAIGEAAAATASDYKALVCVFLYGGNDYANTVVTYDDTSHNLYNSIRSNIALSKLALAPTVLTPTIALPGGRQYALHPAMTGLAGLFNSGVAAVQLNAGPLVVPLTRAQYQGNNRRDFPLPPKLFSHNDQQSVWQSSSPEGSTIGWGGNIGDLALSANTNSLFTCISVTGNAVFLSGDQALAYQVSPNGAVKINGVSSNVYGSAAVKNAMSQLVQRTDRNHLLENEYNRVVARAIGAETGVTGALNLFPATSAPFNTFPANNSLSGQLKMVARLIAARNTLQTGRQVFFVSLGGFDLHDNLISQQPTLMGRVSEAMTAFYNATVALGVADKVTSFTASDFGRTLSSNGDGSDHGWGSHHLMVGAAVRGRAFYGAAPPVSVGNSTTDANDAWHVGQGRLLPGTSVDQYAATLAKWFGVEDNELNGILPNLRNFGVRDLGFMA